MLSIIVPYWSDGLECSLRERNVQPCWNKVKRLYQFLLDNGVECDCTMYNFSEVNEIEDVRHIRCEISGFNKSKRMNLIFQKHRYASYLLCIDADMFFHENDFEQILLLTRSFAQNQVFTFDAAKLWEADTVTFLSTGQVDFNWDWWFAYSGPKENGPLLHSLGGIGGAYILPRAVLDYIGGFDEEFVRWGGEDGKALSDIVDAINSGIDFKVTPIRHFFPFHLNHHEDDRRAAVSRKYSLNSNT